ncbi:uncharacterized protein LOC120072161 [Benincasa hispida]|uniref:uncharacterized protein LOC120072161 n=1 Tax=Benincasa hispida TaxID=102211 RepID=UPI0018FFF16E|nr:uncharacterized protein LOC120072161 [Benincasa hispida]
MPRQSGRQSKQTGGRNTDPTIRGPVVRKNALGRKKKVAASVGSVRANSEKKYGLERFKALGAVPFEEDSKVGLAAFLLQKEPEKWWKVISAKRASTDAMLWSEFKKAFEDKYYPSSFWDEKRDEFLRLTQGRMSVTEYEQKFIELSQYALPIIAEEGDRYRKFE